jgi:hypothetical protein
MKSCRAWKIFPCEGTFFTVEEGEEEKSGGDQANRPGGNGARMKAAGLPMYELRNSGIKPEFLNSYILCIGLTTSIQSLRFSMRGGQ